MEQRSALESAESGRAAPQAVAAARAEKRFYRPELDGLRFVAFVSVFLHHASLPMLAGIAPGGVAGYLASASLAGAFGVDLFFALSSYLITELFLREWESRGSVDVKSFYGRRLLRIWPLYYAFLFVVAVVLTRSRIHDGLTPGATAAFALLSGNWYCVVAGFPESVAAPLWSVSIEEQFYLAWPLIARACLPSRRRLAWACVALLVIANVSRLVLALCDVPHPGVWCNTLARLDPIALGALIALALRSRAPAWGAWTRGALLVVGGALWVVAAAVFPFDRASGAWNAMAAMPLMCLGAGAILVAALGAGGAIGACLRNPVVVYLGRISYGLYVFHLLGLRAVASISEDHLVRAAAGLIVTIVVSVLSFHLLERPFLKMKERLARVESRPGG